MIQAIKALLRPYANHWTRVRVLTNNHNINDAEDKDKDIDDAAVEFQWICNGHARCGDADELHNFICIECTISASNGLFDWYRNLYSSDDGKPLDEPAVFYSSDTAAAVAENKNVPPPPLDMRRNLLVEQIVEDAVFGQRVEVAYRVSSAYPVGIGKSRASELLDVVFVAEITQEITYGK
ncbi:hypothetical protein BGZ47_002496 [Haplosporangium gracile]|nr:hypothetical protein BGZ47_002496 [Haplosporangium gracile]